MIRYIALLIRLFSHPSVILILGFFRSRIILAKAGAWMTSEGMSSLQQTMYGLNEMVIIESTTYDTVIPI